LGLLAFLTFHAHAQTILDDEITALIRRIETLAPQESLWPRIDTLRHASRLLAPAKPDHARALIESADSLQQSTSATPPLPLLEQRKPLDSALKSGDRAAIETAAEEFVKAVEHSAESPDDYAWFTSLRRRHDIVKGGDNASIRVREALAELAELVRTDLDFPLATLDGSPVQLRADTKGITVISFWATWCAPCVEEMRALERIYRRDRVRIVAITDEDAATVRSFLRRYPVTFPVLLDPSRTTSSRFHIDALPALLIVDSTGRLRARVGRVTEDDVVALIRRF
jgi:thiol-disulfide isomerase/thioredoxin